MQRAGLSSDDPRAKNIKDYLSKAIGKNVWSRPDLWHKAIEMWFNSNGM